jgi:hypothetical protein
VKCMVVVRKATPAMLASQVLHHNVGNPAMLHLHPCVCVVALLPPGQAFDAQRHATRE